MLVIGGLKDPEEEKALDSVVCLDLWEEIEEQDNEDVWVDMPSLNRPRHSFGAVRFGDEINTQFVYVFGGIQGRQKNFHPLLADIAIERLDLYSKENPKWEIFEIANMPKLAAFGFSFDTDAEKLFIVGGTDGDILHTEWWQVDIANK